MMATNLKNGEDDNYLNKHWFNFSHQMKHFSKMELSNWPHAAIIMAINYLAKEKMYLILFHQRTELTEKTVIFDTQFKYYKSLNEKGTSA